MKQYAIVINNEIKEIGLTQLHIKNRGISWNNVYEIEEGSAPETCTKFDTLVDQREIVGNKVVINYIAKKKSIDQLFSSIDSNTVELQQESIEYIDHIKSRCEEELDFELDNLAKSKGYRNFSDVVSFANSGIEQYKIDAVSAINLRDNLWPRFYEIFNDIIKGKSNVRSYAALKNNLPKLEL